MDFAEWMKSAGLSEKSANSYVGAIKGRLTNWAIGHQLTKKQIGNISDLAEFLTLAQQLRQTPEFKDRNTTGNGMYAAALSNYEKYLRSLTSEADAGEYGPYQRQVAQIVSEQGVPFDPTGQDDARARVLRQVVQRRGQQKFRKALIAAYGGRCAITACPVTPLLEAAHITPYLGPDTNSISNGLLLRADLHTLWDLGLVAIDPLTRRLWVSAEVDDPTYRDLSGRQVLQPAHPAQQPSMAALHQQWDLAQKTYAEADSDA
ncbi:HNH endonuclease [Massilia phyllosphaerae]|uniref:HNH endonuclease n=1 Tax=Massilia phyllosphaerae TaxID=3106034 RepID=UPI002B1CB58A|nr:HNH endonuclease signature motif containing protein [Massilia sp. SGZ-792]